MAELGFASALLKIKPGLMDDVARTLAGSSRAANATPLEQFAGRVDSARRLFDGAIDDAIEISVHPPAVGDALGGFRGIVKELEQVHRLPVRHRAMGHADTARASAQRVVDQLEAAQKSGATEVIASPKIGSPLFQDLWELRHNLDEAFDAAGSAKVLNDWRP